MGHYTSNVVVTAVLLFCAAPFVMNGGAGALGAAVVVIGLAHAYYNRLK